MKTERYPDPARISEELRRVIDDIAPTEVRREQAQKLRRDLVRAALQRGADKMLAGIAEAEQVRATLTAANPTPELATDTEKE